MSDAQRQDYEILYYRDMYPEPVLSRSRDCYELLFFLEGAVDYQVGDAVYPLEYGDILLIPPGTGHRPRFRAPLGAYRRFILRLSADFYRNLTASSGDFAYGFEQAGLRGRYRLRFGHAPAREIEDRLIELIREHSGRGPFRHTGARLKIASLLLYVNRMLYQADHGDTPAREKSLCLSLCEYIDGHLEDDLSLETLAGAFYVSKYHIAHVFKDNMGISPHQYVTRKRLQASRREILLGLPLNQISLRYGFRDYAGYYRAFRKEFGLSPTRFREQNPVPEPAHRPSPASLPPTSS